MHLLCSLESSSSQEDLNYSAFRVRLALVGRATGRESMQSCHRSESQVQMSMEPVDSNTAAIADLY